MTEELESELEILVSWSCQECRKFGYPPTIFEKMIRKYGAVQAIEKVINKPEPTPGFNKLRDEGRLDLSAEALILERPKFRQLFADDLFEIARKRLDAHEYKLEIK